ncbi:uncharacterized protein LOC114550330 [Perca flavescens]|uniref:uncharacterized protein LOC114550330 n=1 Tax=Perca flavescens TaxID=8167 RepID=UPI00106E6600|nr:uncharacterized protein LOC114550330 [Perca flavescens]
MTTLDLWNTLNDLTDDQFKQFKWFLKQDDILEGFSAIPVAQLEKADRQDTVDRMVEKYQGPGALEVTTKVLGNISRNDLVQRLKNFSLGPKDGAHKDNNRKKPKLKSVQQFAVDVTLDPDTAHPHLILSSDRKQVHHGDVRKKLPHNPERFETCVNILGKQSFSSGRFYFEVQVKGKTAWVLGVAKNSIKRKGSITASPENGYWTIMMRNGEEYEANDDCPVSLSPNHHPQRVGVFVDYDEGLVSFYDADAADLLYSYTSCSFTEKLYPFLSPCTNNGGKNSAPLIISPANHLQNLKTQDFGVLKEEHERKKAELKSVQEFAVDVTLDPDTAHPHLILSGDRKQVHHGDVRKKLPDNPERFYRCVNILGNQSFSSGRFYFEVQVKGKTAWTLGVAKESIKRKGDVTLSPKEGIWTICLENGDVYEATDDPLVNLHMKSHPQRVGVFVDYDEGLVSFYDADAADLLYSYTGCSFTEKLYPFLSPCTNDGGKNSAPLIISPANHLQNLKTQDFSVLKEEHERKKAELKSVQEFAVDVTLDPDTAHPHLILSGDRKQVHHGDVRKKLPDNPERFYRCVNILGNQSFSSGKFYFEVQVKGKTAWTLGVAKESINRKGNITTIPEDGYWTIRMRNGDEYTANDDDPVSLSLNHHPQKVGVFVDYEEGLVSFYDVDVADRLYAFTDCSFTEKLLPYFSPCTNNNGENSAPLIICPVNHL